VDLITDASSIINLDNAQALVAAANLDERTICLSPLVVGECQPNCAALLVRLEQEGLMRFVDPREISAELFLSLLEDHDLGEGETECLALALVRPYVFCCDDRKARRVGVELLGGSRVVGSLRLLKWLVEDGHLSVDEAFTHYESMKREGGFLPEIPREWFGAQ
jgi:predicted nucleic acid-binding protein